MNKKTILTKTICSTAAAVLALTLMSGIAETPFDKLALTASAEASAEEAITVNVSNIQVGSCESWSYELEPGGDWYELTLNEGHSFVLEGSTAENVQIFNYGTIENTSNDFSIGGNVAELLNYNTIKDGTFNFYVCSYFNTPSTVIEGGTFSAGVNNFAIISGGTFTKDSIVFNNSVVDAENSTFSGTVYNAGDIENGVFDGTVNNGKLRDNVPSSGTILGGTFNSEVNNYEEGIINGGTFGETATVKNDGGTIDAADSTFSGTVYNYNEGVIKNGIFNGYVTNGAKADGTLSSAKIEGGTFNSEVNNSEKGEINGGTFSETEAVKNDGGTIDAANITFSGTVYNYNEGVIKNGIFNGNVTNGAKADGTLSSAKIEGGTYNNKVYNNNGTIVGGIFSESCTVYNYNGGCIQKSLDVPVPKFYGTVLNGSDGSSTSEGTIDYGEFSGLVSNKSIITCGTFALLENYGTIAITEGSVTVTGATKADSGIVTVNSETHNHISEYDYEYSESETEGKHLVTKLCKDCPIKYAAVFEEEENHECEWVSEVLSGGVFEGKNTCACGYVDEIVTYTLISGDQTYTGKAINLLATVTSSKDIDRSNTVYYTLGNSLEKVTPINVNENNYSAYMECCPLGKWNFWIKPYDISDVTFTQTEEFTYDSLNKTPEFTATIDLGGEQHTLVKGTEFTFEATTETNAGTYEATITGTGNFKGTATATWEIKKATPTYTPPLPCENLVFDGAEKDLVSGGDAQNGEIKFSLTGEEDSFTGEIPRKTDAGEYTVYWMIKGKENYKDVINSEPIIVSIDKADSEFTALPESLTHTYTGEPQPLIKAGTASGGEVWYSTDNTNYSKEIPTATDAGTYVVYYKIVGDNNHKDVSAASLESKITKATPKIVIPTTTNSIIYGAKLSAVTLSDDTWSWVNGETVPTVKNSGFEAVINVDDKNYDYENVEGYNSETHTLTSTIEVTVDKANVGVTADEQHIVVGDPLPELTYKVTGLAEGEKLTTEPTLSYAENATNMVIGEYEIIIKGAVVNSDNYNIQHVNSKLVVSACNHDGTTEIRHDADNHWFYCTKCYTDNIKTTAHSGGKATCVAKAECEICEAEYGELDSTNHANKAEKLTSDETGHWYACDCGKVDFAKHVSSGEATANNAEVCTICGYEIAPKLTQSESVDSFVDGLYKTLLGREAEEAGLNEWSDKLESGELSSAEIVYSVIGSPEYTQKDYTNEEMVEMLYQTMLGRASDLEGKKYWVERLDAGMTIKTIVNGFSGSPEFTGICEDFGIDAGSIELTEARDQNFGLTSFVTRMYTEALGRRYDEAGVNDWTNRYLTSAASISDIAYGFIFSPEFQNKALSDSDFVDTLYRTFFDREPDEGGKADWMNKLANGMSREDVLGGFVGSQECENLIAGFGI